MRRYSVWCAKGFTKTRSCNCKIFVLFHKKKMDIVRNFAKNLSTHNFLVICLRCLTVHGNRGVYFPYLFYLGFMLLFQLSDFLLFPVRHASLHCIRQILTTFVHLCFEGALLISLVLDGFLSGFS